MRIGGKYTFHVDHRKLVVVKKPVEHVRHVVMKALLWALYLPMYPRLEVEVSIGYKYKPDLVDVGPDGPRFWAEAGRVRQSKLKRVLKRFPHTHFAFASWGHSLTTMHARFQRAAQPLNRDAPIDLITFPEDAGDRYVDRRGRIDIRHVDLDWQQLV